MSSLSQSINPKRLAYVSHDLSSPPTLLEADTLSSQPVFGCCNNVDEDGFTLPNNDTANILADNDWQQMETDVTATKDTVLTFDSSSKEGETDGIDLENGDDLAENFFFKLDSTHDVGIEVYDDLYATSSSLQSPSSDVGQALTSVFDQFASVMDDNAGRGDNGTLSDISVSTEDTLTPPPSRDAIMIEVTDFTGTTSYSDSASKPTYSLDQVADYLTDGYWADTGRSGRSFNLDSSGTLDVNITALTAEGQNLAENALQAWSDVSGIKFAYVSNGADITFDDNQSGAFSSSSSYNGTIFSSSVNVSSGWISSYGSSLSSWTYQTYIHEIGHALGLGHGGDYNGNASYGTDAAYSNDTRLTSIMSYFSQSNDGGSNVNVITPQIADILAIQNLYGSASSARSGDTTYGVNATSDAHVNVLGTTGFTIYDGGGVDHINLSSKSNNQRIDLNAETFSDINGRSGNMAIARGTTIENVTTGSGSDTITGNNVANRISTGAGNDTINAGNGDDVITGGAGSDLINGQGGSDTAVFSGAAGDYTVLYDYSTASGASLRLRDTSGATDTLTSIETLQIGSSSYSVSAIIDALKSGYGTPSSGASAIAVSLDSVTSGDTTPTPTTTPTTPPTTTTADITLSLDGLETGSFGNSFNGQTDADGVITAGFQNTGSDLQLTFKGYDVDVDNEIEIFLNGTSLGFLDAGINNGLAEYTIEIAAADQVAGENIVTFDQARNDTWKWGVTDLLLSEANTPTTTTTTTLLNSGPLTGFSNQDKGSYTLSNNDTEITLTNNAWKQLATDVTVTTDTVLTFDFASSKEGEIHGIGFENDDFLSESFIFKLDGTQDWGIDAYDGLYTTGRGLQSYTINVGDHFTGDFDRIVFVMDDDAGLGGDSTFANFDII